MKAIRKGAQTPMLIAWIAVGLMLVFVALHYAGIYAFAFVGSIAVMCVLWFVGVLRAVNHRWQEVTQQAQPQSLTPEQFADAVMFGDGQHVPAGATVAVSEPEHVDSAPSDESNNAADDNGAHGDALSA